MSKSYTHPQSTKTYTPFGGLDIPSITPQMGSGVSKTVNTPGKIPSDQTSVVGQPAISMPKNQSNVLTDPKSGWKFNPSEQPGMALNQPDSIAYRHGVLNENNQIGTANQNEYNRVHKQEETWRRNVDAEQRSPTNPNAAAYATQQAGVQQRIMSDPEVMRSRNMAGKLTPGHSSKYTDMDINLAGQQQDQIDADKKASQLGSDSPERKEKIKQVVEGLGRGKVK